MIVQIIRIKKIQVKINKIMNNIQNERHTNLSTYTVTNVRTAQRFTELFNRSISCPTKIKQCKRQSNRMIQDILKYSYWMIEDKISSDHVRQEKKCDEKTRKISTNQMREQSIQFWQKIILSFFTCRVHSDLRRHKTQI